MNNKSRFAVALTSTVLIGTLAIGAVASAAGGGGTSADGPGTGRQGLPHLTAQHLTTQQKCDKQPEIASRVTTAKQRLEQRIATVQQRKDAADAAGHTERSAKLQQRIDRLHKVETRIDTKYADYQTWVKANCPAA